MKSIPSGSRESVSDETPKRPRKNHKIIFKKTIILVFLLSLAVHLLLLISFGGQTLFKGRVPKMPFTSERVGSDKIVEAVAPPTEDMSPAEEPRPEATAAESLPPQEDSNPMPEVISVPKVSTWAPPLSRESKAAPAGLSGLGSPAGAKAKVVEKEASKSPVFFGIKIDAEAPRIVLVLDTSNTMFKRRRGKETFVYDYGVVKKEAIDLVRSLDESARFNVVLYEGGAIAYQNNPSPMSGTVKEQVCQWIGDIDENPNRQIKDRKGGDSLMEGGGTRLDTALKLAFRYDPTTIFLLTDGEANMQTEKGSKKLKEEDLVPLIKQLQEKQKTRAVIHVIHYLTSEAQDSETELLKAIAKQGRGKVKVVEAKVTQTEAGGGAKENEEKKRPKNPS